jgi:asparagine synthase (glutamine-hydrolysing)
LGASAFRAEDGTASICRDIDSTLMCGFAGIGIPQADRDVERLSADVRPMIDVLDHRGPDDSGIWIDPAAGIALGHRRLAVVDLTSAGHQPMRSRCGRFVTVYNGEIYNFRELRQKLKSAGYRFAGNSDTEVLLAAVGEWGIPGALSRFIGMFAFALWDSDERVLYLARDRIGEKPLYYGWSGDAVIFGSELKALRAYSGWRGDYDLDAVSHFLHRCYVPAPLSIYQGIRKLVPGTYLKIERFRSGQLPDPVKYWSISDAVVAGATDPFRGSPEEAVDQLEALVRRAVGQQMVADVPLGAFLSGGIDSSAVAALMQALSSRPVKTFSIGFHDPRFNEAEHAASVARHLGTDHTELYVTADEAMAVIPKLPALYDEPFADSSQIPTYLVSQLARRSVTVSLSGDGGDELFGGYVRHFLGPWLWNRIRWLPGPLRRGTGRVLRSIPARFWDGLDAGFKTFPGRTAMTHPAEKARKLAGLLEAGSPSAVYLALISAWQPHHDVVIGATARSDHLASVAEDVPAGLDFASRMMVLDLLTYLPDDILVKVDRAAMGVSLETRIPYLDHRIVEFAWRLPLEYKIRGGVAKWPLRQMLYRYVPRQLVERPKAGFAVPVGDWLRGPLRPWAEELLDEGGIIADGLFRPEPIRRAWTEHLDGVADRMYQLWNVLMFRAWAQTEAANRLSKTAGTSPARVSVAAN